MGGWDGGEEEDKGRVGGVEWRMKREEEASGWRACGCCLAAVPAAAATE